MARKFLETISTPAALRAQEHFYGRSRPVAASSDYDPLGPTEAEFIAARDSFYMATVTETGWPYVQHRGGPPGFLRVLGPTTLAFADYEGNHQMVSTGNLAGDRRVALFLMDYAHRRRLKVLGRARVIDAREQPDLVAQFVVSPQAHVERVVEIEVLSFDWNCPQHITPRFTAEEIAAVVEPLRRQIAELQGQLAGAAARPPQEETDHV
ncbi:MAG TPA: pyridoxamine 5'-phosphate oxidase family protein [Candidatus Limnocylindria bacterium]|nr:pyridoxamine 5'-phosphate oxidase family protein [Candidatus Limnocylindria bacterium]